MNEWQAFIGPYLDRVMGAPEYADATDEEVAELAIQMCPPTFRWPAIERRWLREAIARRRDVTSARSSQGDRSSVPIPDHPLTRAEAIELVRTHGSLRRAAKASGWSYSHIARVRAGERGKASI
jgi:hypothetical protein